MVGIAPEGTEELLDEAVRRLVERLRPERIYLFGSRARGDALEESDYDLMVVVPEPEIATIERVREGREVLSKLLSPLDLLIWPRDAFERQLPVIASLPATIAREGRLIYQREASAAAATLGIAGGNGGSMDAEKERLRLTWDWIEKAEEDLVAAETLLRHTTVLDSVAYHGQQAFEKALMAFLTWHDEPFRKTHELKELLRQCEQYHAAFAQLRADAKVLGPYVAKFRYPGLGPNATATQATAAVQMARDTLVFVKAKLPATPAP
ncbi:MAG: HEPN domain-containing protein [Dehalococcoidia bacterium]